MAEVSLAGARSAATANASLKAANAPATSAPEQTKLRRDKMFFIGISSPGWHCRGLDMRGPALFILAAPHLHRFGVALDLSVFRVEVQLTVDFPRDVGKLQHGNGDVAYRDWSVELFAFADPRNKVREVQIGHGIGSAEVGR